MGRRSANSQCDCARRGKRQLIPPARVDLRQAHRPAGLIAPTRASGSGAAVRRAGAAPIGRIPHGPDSQPPPRIAGRRADGPLPTLRSRCHLALRPSAAQAPQDHRQISKPPARHLPGSPRGIACDQCVARFARAGCHPPPPMWRACCALTNVDPPRSRS